MLFHPLNSRRSRFFRRSICNFLLFLSLLFRQLLQLILCHSSFAIPFYNTLSRLINSSEVDFAYTRTSTIRRLPQCSRRYSYLLLKSKTARAASSVTYLEVRVTFLSNGPPI